jgi:hypothetical protein
MAICNDWLSRKRVAKRARMDICMLLILNVRGREVTIKVIW